MGACGRVLSCQTLDVIASREPDSVGAYLMLKALGRGSREPRYILSQGDVASWADKQ
jgi:hypothetical protein